MKKIDIPKKDRHKWVYRFVYFDDIMAREELIYESPYVEMNGKDWLEEKDNKELLKLIDYDCWYLRKIYLRKVGTKRLYLFKKNNNVKKS